MPVLNHEIEAENCSSCGTPWRRCLTGGWADTSDEGPHPMDVCCRECHETDTHRAAEARRREEERRKTLPERERMPDVLKFVRSSTAVQDRHEAAALELLAEMPAPQVMSRALAELELARWRMDGLRRDADTLTQQRDIRDRQAREFRQSAERNGRRAQDLETELRGTQEKLRVALAERDVARRDRGRIFEEMGELRERLGSINSEVREQLRSTERRVEAGAEGLTTQQLLAELQRRLDEPRAPHDVLDMS
jgi:hypothetical protein